MVGPREILAASKPIRVRRDIAASDEPRGSWTRGVPLLGSPGAAGSFWSRLTDWYRSSAPTYNGRPAYFPWIRWMLLLLESELRVALADPEFALPYRNWSAGQPLVIAALAQTVYDSAPWDETSRGFRSRMGALIPRQEPDDPDFYLVLCNADRLWAAWQTSNSTRPYLPAQHAPPEMFPHRRNDPIQSPLTATAPTNGQLLNVSRIYGYDSLTG